MYGIGFPLREKINIFLFLFVSLAGDTPSLSLCVVCFSSDDLYRVLAVLSVVSQQHIISLLSLRVLLYSYDASIRVIYTTNRLEFSVSLPRCSGKV